MTKPLAVAAAALVTVLGGFAAPGQSLDSPALVRVNARTAIERESFSGERLTQAAWIYDRRGRRIGTAVTLCDDLGSGGPLGSGTSYCRGSYVFPLGKIVALGTRKIRTSYVLVVVGGTGIYAGVSGTLLVETFALKPRIERLLFSLEPT